jgi:peptidoglycan/xylan/chitin deacetylase (PgdA/CDA1 family)
MTVRNRLGDIRRQVWCSLSRRPVPLGQKGPIVSFTFDDFPRSAYLAGAPILESYGARGTYYVSMSLINTMNKLGEQFRMEDLFALTQRGHELGSHTFSHVSAQRVDCSNFTQDVQKGEEALRSTTGRRSSGNFAYPYGAITLITKRRIGPTLRSCRGTCHGLNGPQIDLNLLRANPLYGDISAVESARKLIDACVTQRSWLIFYSHDVSRHPSPYGCTPELLEAVCSFASQRSARFLTVDATLAELNQQEANN